MKLNVIDWSTEALERMHRKTGKCEGEIVKTIEIDEFTGFSYDGGRLDIAGHPETIYLFTNEFSVRVDNN